MAYICRRLTSIYGGLLAKIPRTFRVCDSIHSSVCHTVKMEIKPFEPPTRESYMNRNEKLNRPMSPHLLIYAPEITSVMSLSHRISGIIIGVYCIFLGFAALFLRHDMAHYITMVQKLSIPWLIAFILKLILAFPFTYHAANGVRHLIWDTGRLLTMPEVYKSAYIVLTVSAVLAFFLALL